MKQIAIIAGVLAACATVMTACENTNPMYEGPTYAMFADSLTVCPVEQSGETTAVRLGITRALDRDCTFGIEVIDQGSNAVDGYHYILETNTVTIPAGQLVASVNVRGIYDHIGDADSLGFRLRLVAPDEAEWDLYGMQTKVRLQKICPFVLENFTGYARVQSSFQILFKRTDQYRIFTTSISENKENTVVLHDFLYDGYDVELELNNTNRLDPRVRMCEGIIGTTDEAFSAIYGDKQLRIQDYKAIPSFFYSCANTATFYATIYVKDFGVVGSFVFFVEWISDDEATGI